MLTLAFTPVDTWFFRESRPMESLGGTSLGNQFPPSPSTLMGALRTRIGDMLGADWNNLVAKPLPAWWGDTDQWGDLTLGGPWLRIAGEDYFPTPACLLQAADGKSIRLQPGSAVHCDLGVVRLPQIPASTPPGVKPLDDSWLRAKEFRQLLSGQPLPHPLPVKKLPELFQDEYRLGIAINPERRAVVDGQLYQTRHLRSQQDLAVMITLDGLPSEVEAQLHQQLIRQPLLRLGGEGRMAQVTVMEKVSLPSLSGTPTKNSKLLAIALNDIPISKADWPLPGFVKQQHADGIQCWRGELEGRSLTLLTMTSGKVRRQGGWDLQHHQPRAVQSLLPAGTVFFFDEPLLPHERTAITHLHAGQTITLALGCWNDTY